MREQPIRNKPWYTEFVFDSLDDFRRNVALIPADSPNPWHEMVFRGIGKESYKLVPSAFRHDDDHNPEIIKYYPSYDKQIWGDLSNSVYAVIKAELSELKRLYDIANTQGLAVPEIEYFKEKSFSIFHSRFMDSLKVWPDSSMLELMTFAQHYGLPTRLLDWTYDINTALYFALRDVVCQLENKLCKSIGPSSKKIITIEPFVVWAVRVKSIQGIYEEYVDVDCPIKFYVPVYANNPNLHAQKGLLSYEISPISEENHLKPFEIKPVDEQLNDFFEYLSENIGCVTINNEEHFMSNDYHLCKLIFRSINPVAELKYLSQQGYNAASLFPGYNGVVEKIKEDQMIERLQELNISVEIRSNGAHCEEFHR